MKYVVLRENVPNGLLVVVLGFIPITHVQLAGAFAATHVPISAGFCEPLATGGWRTFGRSTSLNLSPREADALLIAAFHRATIRQAV